MGEVKHTPGPWFAGSNCVVSAASPDALARVGKRSATVADCRVANGQNDAYLIAAAPDMYEAHDKHLATLMEMIDDPSIPEGWRETIAALCVEKEDILAKARGEQ